MRKTTGSMNKGSTISKLARSGAGGKAVSAAASGGKARAKLGGKVTQAKALATRLSAKGRVGTTRGAPTKRRVTKTLPRRSTKLRLFGR